MSIFYDGIDSLEIESLQSKGILRGITTNLTLVNNQKKVYNKSRIEILEPIVKQAVEYDIPISIQLENNLVPEMIQEAIDLKDSYKHVKKLYLKVPVDFDKLAVISKLSREKILVNATCITAWPQAQIAVEAGATIVSFFWGKMSDQGINPYDHVQKFTKWKNDNDLDHVVTLVGSIRQVSTMYSAYEAGANVVTTSLANIKKFVDQLTSIEANSLFQQTNIPRYNT
jgi:transaldolase